MSGTVTTLEAALLAGVTQPTVRSWQRRGLLQPLERWRGTNHYRVADVWAAEALARRRDRTGAAATRRPPAA